MDWKQLDHKIKTEDYALENQLPDRLLTAILQEKLKENPDNKDIFVV